MVPFDTQLNCAQFGECLCILLGTGHLLQYNQVTMSRTHWLEYRSCTILVHTCMYTLEILFLALAFVRADESALL